MKQWWSRQTAARWQADLVWYRWRYEDGQRAGHCLRLLSHLQACGRVALSYQPPALFVGVSRSHDLLLRRLTADFGVLLKPAAVSLTAVSPFVSVADLPWQRPFVAQVVSGGLFVTAADGVYWPHPTVPTTWQLPQPPPPGLSRQPVWPEAIPAQFLAPPPPDAWPLGYSQTGQPLSLSGNLALYGHRESAAAWLCPLITQLLQRERPPRLVVLDGAGLLVPQLKREWAVTRLLGQSLTYLSLETAAFVTGLNPLAPLPGEPDAAALARWQEWLHLPQAEQAALPLAWQAGVRDIPALAAWGQKRPYPVLNRLLRRLLADTLLSEWLSWPADPFTRDILLFSCDSQQWPRAQVLRLMRLAAAALPHVWLVVVDYPWLAEEKVAATGPVILAHGPPLPGSTVVWTQCDAPQGLNGRDPQWQENVILLQPGQGMVVTDETAFLTTWRDK